VFKNTVVNQITVVSICWLKLQTLRLLYNTTINTDLNILWTGDADLRLYITTVKDG